eukprot:1160652-Pelagomonas_calceolata.AAC.3
MPGFRAPGSPRGRGPLRGTGSGKGSMPGARGALGSPPFACRVASKTRDVPFKPSPAHRKMSAFLD